MYLKCFIHFINCLNDGIYNDLLMLLVYTDRPDCMMLVSPFARFYNGRHCPGGISVPHISGQILQLKLYLI